MNHLDVLKVIHSARDKRGAVYNDKRNNGRRIKFESHDPGVVAEVSAALRKAKVPHEVNRSGTFQSYGGIKFQVIHITDAGWTPKVKVALPKPVAKKKKPVEKTRHHCPTCGRRAA